MNGLSAIRRWAALSRSPSPSPKQPTQPRKNSHELSFPFSPSIQYSHDSAKTSRLLHVIIWITFLKGYKRIKKPEALLHDLNFWGWKFIFIIMIKVIQHQVTIFSEMFRASRMFPSQFQLCPDLITFIWYSNRCRILGLRLSTTVDSFQAIPFCAELGLTQMECP